MTLRSQLAYGELSHHRFAPVNHNFTYKVGMVLLDLNEVDSINRLPFWSSKRFNLIQYRRKDYIGPAQLPIEEAVYQQLKKHGCPIRPARIQLLTNLRNWGYCFNPVSFYFCHDDNDRLYAIVSQINNTPWNERYTYVNLVSQHHNVSHSFTFPKEFHVSPFMPMKLEYKWNFLITGEKIQIHMKLLEEGKKVFGSFMKLKLEPLTPRSALRFPFRYALMTTRVLSAIYFQALRLYWKKVPFFVHPAKEVKHEN